MVTTVLPVAKRPSGDGSGDGDGAGAGTAAPGTGAAGADLRGAGAWLAVVAVALGWGTARVADAGVGLRAAPLYGRWSWHAGPGLVPAVLVAAAVIAVGPLVAARCPWRRLPLLAGVAAVVWVVALAASGGWDQVAAPLASDHEYLPTATRIDDLGAFLDGYVEHLPGQPIHVQGHPPGPVVLAWGLDGVGLGGAGWLAAVAIGGWGVAVAAALVAAGEGPARRAAPALALLPAAVWAGTSMDALFAGIAAAAIAAGVAAARRGSAGWAVTAGGGAGIALLCTYGAPLVLLVGVAGAAAVRPARPLRLLGAAAAGAAVPLGLAAWAGFWWPEGLAATGEAYWDGIASSRPAVVLTLVGNPAALALAAGPAVAAGLWAVAGRATRATRSSQSPRSSPSTPSSPLSPSSRSSRSTPATRPSREPHDDTRYVLAGALVGETGGIPTGALVGETGDVPVGRGGRGRRAWWREPGVVLPVAALVAVVLADLSQMSRGEVERIWLPFVPWLALAAPGDRRPWLAAQVAVALALESSLVSAW